MTGQAKKVTIGKYLAAETKHRHATLPPRGAESLAFLRVTGHKNYHFDAVMRAKWV
jgi:hypothetical protein